MGGEAIQVEKFNSVVASIFRTPVMWAVVIALATFTNFTQTKDSAETIASLVMVGLFGVLVFARMLKLTHTAIIAGRNTPTLIWFLILNTSLVFILTTSGIFLLATAVDRQLASYLPSFDSMTRAVITAAFIATLATNTAESRTAGWNDIISKAVLMLGVATLVYYFLHVMLQLV